jgi:uncharacterized protein YrzB (UPF0473 family)
MSGSDNGIGHVDSFDESEEIQENEVVEIEDEDGNSHSCVVLAIIEHAEQDYAMLAPAAQLTEPENGEEAELEIFLFQYDVTDDGVECYSYIEDPERFEEVRTFCATLMEQEGLDEDDA